jgi:hypothetical protein
MTTRGVPATTSGSARQSSGLGQRRLGALRATGRFDVLSCNVAPRGASRIRMVASNELEGGVTHDVFVCHASEDKADFVNDLVKALCERGLRVWFDAVQVTLGDDFRRAMERGLLGARFGVVVLSPAFLASKYWTEQELSALFSLEASTGTKRILPVLYGISWSTLVRSHPFLGTRLAADASSGVDNVAAQVDTAVRAAPAPSAARASRLYNIPLPSQSFVGRRQELAEMELQLAQGDVRVSASIEGLPGIGKTALVLKLAHELAAAGKFPGGIFWLPSETPDLAPLWGSDAIAGALGIPGDNPSERARNAINTLSRRDAAMLVILDNVENWDSQSAPGPLPTGPNITLLVTSRRSGLGGNRFRHFALKFLGPAEARSVIITLAGAQVAKRNGFDQLLSYLDGHTLALELAGIYLREYPHVTPAKYLDSLLAGANPDGRVGGEARYERSVSQAFALLWRRLDRSTRAAWQLASQFAPEPATAALADACGLDAEACRDLRRYHLIELDQDGSFRMHRLTRAFGQGAGDANTRATARQAFLHGVTERAALIDGNAGFRIYTPDRAHFDAALSLARAGDDSRQYSVLLSSIAFAAYSLGDANRARQLLEDALRSDLEDLGEGHPDVAASRSNLGLVLYTVSASPNPSVRARRPVRADLIGVHVAGTVKEPKGASSSAGRSLVRVAAQWFGASSR